MKRFPTLATLVGDLDSGRITAVKLVEDCLSRVADPRGEGGRAFIQIDAEAALASAAAMDNLRRHRVAPSVYAGIPISIKDLFDVAGQVTRAGSKVLVEMQPAESDAPAIARLRSAGFVIIGRTNMTEFAYSGLGINPHYGTPLNPWDRLAGRVPGGSSSGAAVSVSDGMAHAGIGTDTGGSCRIPAAFTGLVGFKPTAARVPLAGCIPLSPSLDSVGSIARSVGCCVTMDTVISGESSPAPSPRPLRGLRLAAPTNVVLDDLDDKVAEAFENALGSLANRGVQIDRIVVPEFDRVGPMNAKGGFTAAESFAWHRALLSSKADMYDPRVLVRIRRGALQSAADYLDIQAQRRSLIADTARRLAVYDAFVMPTVAIVPPILRDLDDDEAYGRANLLALRNCTLINMVDGCAISLPIARSEVPVGLMLAAGPEQDRNLLSIASAVEADVST